MRVLFDIEAALYHPGGMAGYALRLFDALRADAGPDDEYKAAYSTGNPLRAARFWRLARQRLDPPRPRYIPWPNALLERAPALARLWLSKTFDVLHAPANRVPPWAKLVDVPRVITVHDTGWRADAPGHCSAPAYRQLVAASLLPALARPGAVVAAPSRFTRDEIVRHLGFPPERIVVTPEGLAWEGLPEPGIDAARRAIEGRGLIRGGYVLAVGEISPRKNLPVLLEAFARLRVQAPEARLVIVGRPGWECEGVLRDIADAAPAVVHLQGLPTDELRALYSAARVVACPSLYEGFGLPALEAMASGVALAYTSGSSMDEVAADAGLAVLPDGGGEAFGAALLRLWMDPAERAARAEAGRRRAAAFTWKNCADATRQAYRRAIQSGAGEYNSYKGLVPSGQSSLIL